MELFFFIYTFSIRYYLVKNNIVINNPIHSLVDNIGKRLLQSNDKLFNISLNNLYQ